MNIIKLKKNFIILILFCAMLFLATSAEPQQVTSISVTPQFNTVSPGDSFTIDIWVDPGPNEVYAAQYDLIFDPTKLQATDQTPGPFLSQDGAGTLPIADNIDNDNGIVSYGEIRFGTLDGVTNPGILASVTFHVNESLQPGETTTLELTNVIIADPQPLPIVGVLITNGTVEIPEGPAVNIIQPIEDEVLTTDTVIVNYVESGDLAEVDHAALSLDSGAEVQDYDNDGVYTFNSVPEGEHTLEVWLVDAGNNHLAGAYDIVNFSIEIPHYPRVEVVIPEENVGPGTEFTASIVVDPDEEVIYAGQYVLHFDNIFLEALEQTQGPFLSQDGASTLVMDNTIDNANGITSYGESTFGPGGVTTPGSLAYVTFRVNDNAPEGLTTLDLSDVILADTTGQPIPNIILINDSVNIMDNIPPVADFTYIGTDGVYGLDIDENMEFDASQSHDSDGTIVSYDWDFGDGYSGSGVTASHVYSHSGTYTVTLEVTDNGGASDLMQQEITIELVGDINHDGIVNILDVVIIALNWQDVEIK